MSPDKVFDRLLAILCEDNGGKIESAPSHKMLARPDIEVLQRAGFFADDETDLDGSFWRFAAGEESETWAYFTAGQPQHVVAAFDSLHDLFNEIFQGGPDDESVP